MNTIVTKETWSSDPDNAPLPSDFNRIESNTRNVEENRQEETTARQNADTTLQNNIDSEATAMANADTTLQNNIDSEATARLNGDAGYYGSSVNLTDYPIGSIILARTNYAQDRNATVAPSYIGGSATQFFTLDAAPGNLDGVWKARGTTVGSGGYYDVLCQRIS